jgi:hypothetical protein
MRPKMGEHGIALVLVLLTMALVASVGLGLALSSTLAVVSVTNYAESVALLNAAEAGIDLAARELAVLAVDEVLGGVRTSTCVDGPPGSRTLPSGLTIDLPTMTNQLTCGRAAPCTNAQVGQITATRPWGANNPRWRLFVHQLLPLPALPRPAPDIYVVVWIGDDAREADGDPTTDGAGAGQEGRYIVRARAEAFGHRGGRRAIEAELARMCVAGPAGEVCVPGSRVQSWRAVSSLVP